MTPSLVEHLNGARGDILDFANRIVEQLDEQSTHLAALVGQAKEKQTEVERANRSSGPLNVTTNPQDFQILTVPNGHYWLVKQITVFGPNLADVDIFVGSTDPTNHRWNMVALSNSNSEVVDFLVTERMIITARIYGQVGKQFTLNFQVDDLMVPPKEMSIRG